MIKIDASNLDKKINMALNDIGYLIEGRAKERCPVKTGNLRRNISHQVEGDTVTIGTFGVDYADYVEYGTSRMIDAHGEHDPYNPVTDWEALRKRTKKNPGGSGQTMPFLRNSAFESEHDIMRIIRGYFK